MRTPRTLPFKVYMLRPDRRLVGYYATIDDAKIGVEQQLRDFPRVYSGAEIWDAKTDRPLLHREWTQTRVHATEWKRVCVIAGGATRGQ